MELTFIKVHGSQNDFFIIDEIDNRIVDWTDVNRRIFTKQICDRSHELGGADGVLFVSASINAGAAYKMRVFNSDTSEASMCGNGLRTVARYLLEKEDEKQLIVETMKANLEVAQAESLGFGIPTYQVEISPVLFEPEALPFHYNGKAVFNEPIPELDNELAFSTVAVPNPHLISFVDQEQLDSDKQETLASFLNGENPYFPDGVNVSFVKRLAADKIYVRTFERGVGFTNACGTAMSASSLIKKQLDDDTLEAVTHVYNDGGRVQVTAEQADDGTYKLHLIGNATFTKTGIVRFDEAEGISVIQAKETGEEENYQQLVKETTAFLQENV